MANAGFQLCKQTPQSLHCKPQTSWGSTAENYCPSSSLGPFVLQSTQVMKAWTTQLPRAMAAGLIADLGWYKYPSVCINGLGILFFSLSRSYDVMYKTLYSLKSQPVADLLQGQTWSHKLGTVENGQETNGRIADGINTKRSGNFCALEIVWKRWCKRDFG